MFSNSISFINKGKYALNYLSVSQLRSFSVIFQGKELPSVVSICEVGPRDGLQNEPKQIPTEVKVELINKLKKSGLKNIEATSFVSPKWVPQLADAADLLRHFENDASVMYPVLTPNLKGFENALKAKAKVVGVFPAASEAFSKKNLNCSIDESLKRFGEVMTAAKKEGVLVRGYVSCVVGCPYQGVVEPKAAADVAGALYEMGAYEVSMGDTIGVGTPASMTSMFQETMKQVPVKALAAHCHDTYGQALSNILASLQLGIQSFDSSVAGLGGCPFARGATGNVATEDLVYMLNGLGIQHGIDLDALLDASIYISGFLERPPESRAARALISKRNKKLGEEQK